MNKFYHLSRSQDAKAIVLSTDPRGKECTDKFFSPRTPRSRAGEPPDPRICVAPTVWQCLISWPDLQSPTPLIYSLQCRGAIRVCKNEHGVEDADVTYEHWITDAIISQNGCEIALIYEGALTNADEDRFKIQTWMAEKRKAAVDFTKTKDTEFWNEEWQFRLRYQLDIDEEPPLPPRFRAWEQ